MVGIILAGHGEFAEGLLKATEAIVGRIEKLEVVSSYQGIRKKEMEEEMKRAFSRVATKKGILILTDIFGSTPSNVVGCLNSECKIVLVTGVNLPMMLDLALNRKMENVEALALRLHNTGKKSVIKVVY